MWHREVFEDYIAIISQKCLHIFPLVVDCITVDVQYVCYTCLTLVTSRETL